MENDFRKNGAMRVRYETAEERREILRILRKSIMTDTMPE